MTQRTTPRTNSDIREMPGGEVPTQAERRRWNQPAPHSRAERLAREFHEQYEALAPEFGYRTRAESAVPWDEVPTANRELMKATVTRLLERGVIR